MLNQRYPGTPFYTPEELGPPFWEFMNTFTPDTDGVSREDIGKVFRIWEEFGKRL